MRRPLSFLWLLTVPALVSMSPPPAPARKDVLQVSIRGDSGSAQHFTVVTEGLHVFARRQRLEQTAVAPDTLTVLGTGSLEIISADSGKFIVAEVRRISAEISEIERFSGRTLKISRKYPNDGYTITDR